MSAPRALTLGLCLTATACATAPKLPEGSQIVQLSLSGTPEPCDWSGQYEPTNVPDQWALGATYWPHSQPRSGKAGRAATAPLTFYGTQTQFTASETSPVLCLRLFKRPSAFHEGIAPVAVIEIHPEGEMARVRARRLDPKITALHLGFIQKGLTPTLTGSLVGGQLVQTSSPTEANEKKPQEDTLEQTRHTLILDISSGRAEAQVPSPSYTATTQLALVASQAGGHEGAEKTLMLLISTPITGATDARFQDGHLVLISRFP